MLKTVGIENSEAVGENQIRGCEVRFDQVSKQYTQGKELVAALNKVSLEVKTGTLFRRREIGFGNLDSKTGDQILFILKEITQDLGVIMIMVTHDPMVAAYGYALITLKDGRILDSAAR